jgi:hypothetical protein
MVMAASMIVTLPEPCPAGAPTARRSEVEHGLSLEQDAEKWEPVFSHQSCSKLFESITFMILDRPDPKSS